MRAAELLGPSGPIARALEGYEHREGQLAMAEAVERVLEREGVLFVEAGTGIGKTLAYLVPALRSGQKVILSTGTRNLQDQIMKKDLPWLREHLEPGGFGRDESRTVCLKGLSNYVCLHRLVSHRLSLPGIEGERERQLAVLDAWVERTQDGDRAELRELDEDAPIWSDVTSSTDTRIGPRCDYYEDCFVTRARRRAEAADIVVVNHHLFFADLALRRSRGVGVLPDYQVVIFDEAHQIEDVATQFFSAQLSSTQLTRLAKDATRTLSRMRAKQVGARLAESLALRSQAFFEHVPRAASGVRVDLPDELLHGQLEASLFALDSALEALGAHIANQDDASEGAEQVGRRVAGQRGALAQILEGARGGRICYAQASKRGVKVASSPVHVGELLREELFTPTPTVVLTSATLTTSGKFSFIESRLGVDFEVEELCVPSSFDYPAQAGIYTPADMPDPRSASFLDRAEAEVKELVAISGGGAFVLSTSKRVMKELHRRCAGDLPGPALLQGQAPKAALLERFRAAGDATLFATASFWEGVDVPGQALRLVVIDKLPFAVPTDPLIAARCNMLEQEGVSSFMKYLLPQAALALEQGFGRLIRSNSDRGVVAILDSRIVTKGYGKTFLKSLPPARRIHDLDGVRAFFHEAS
ncbi:MAG: ATP-dependent DNA helicase [Deltaproteobacteria bacterium]|nr:ATP-dependent DNA helicase [Deltaproteobacteria bacterium]